MGVRFFDKENMPTEGIYTITTSTSCNCKTCNQQKLSSSATTKTTTTSNTTATQTTNSLNNSESNNLNFQMSNSLREIVGNSKEMRIESNTHNLHIVGNNNRIRISFNVGDITIIGNNTRLKIKTNHGHIKYTGNDGRISLGKASTEQLVEYSGCNGVLKIQNSKKTSQVNAGNLSFNAKSDSSKKRKEKKYASCNSSLPVDSEAFNYSADYSNIFNRKKSSPNITTKPLLSENASTKHAHQLPSTMVNNIGSIVIANSSNICISPYSYST